MFIRSFNGRWPRLGQLPDLCTRRCSQTWAIGLALLVLAVAAPGSAMAGTPASLTVIPAQGVAGTKILVTGSGVPPRRSASLTLNGLRLAGFRADRHGHWAVRARLPRHTAAGRPRLGILVAGASVVQARFVVTRTAVSGTSATSLVGLSSGESVRLSPTRAIAGSTVKVNGAGFRRHARVDVWLGGAHLVTLSANGGGSLRAFVRVPVASRTGAYVLSVRSKGRRLELRLGVTAVKGPLPVPPSGSPGPVPIPLPIPPVPPPVPPGPPAAPTVAGIPDQTALVGTPINPVTPFTTGQVSGFSASGLPPGLTVASSSGVVSGAPTANGAYTSTETVTGPGGSASATFSWTISTTVGDPTVDAVGDMACSPTDPNYHSGNGVPGAVYPNHNCLQKAVSDVVVNQLPNAFLGLGDNQYDYGQLVNYQTVFGPTFGRANSVVYPALGNAEYGSNGTTYPSGFFGYFANSGVFARIQAGGGDSSNLTTGGYYSFSLGTWHIIALNSNCAAITGGCGVGSSEERWLKADLAAHSHNRCTLAFWHHPRWNSGSLGNDSSSSAFWTDLYAAHATLVLNGHGNHHYERFTPQNPSGAPDSAGIREFIVSTGGQSHGNPPITPGDPSTRQMTDYTTFGVLKLTLHPDSYDYNLAPASGTGTFTDSGSGTCVN
ncbi:MAG: putative Ig domain-containing protein [Actinomycetota bacterium]|nr:putative Ig domain-containing protein [Actinomycetota bacterium]